MKTRMRKKVLLPAILSIVLMQVAVKTLYEILILPLTTWLAGRLKRAEGIDTYDYDISYRLFTRKNDSK